MREAHGNIWTWPEAEAICIPTNGIVDARGKLVMGAGVAHQAAMRYPDLPALFGGLVRKYGNVPCVVFYEEKAIISFPTKHDWRDPSDTELIAQSARKMLEIELLQDLSCIVLPPVGCGLGGLNWETQVAPILEPLLDNRHIVLFPPGTAITCMRYAPVILGKGYEKTEEY